MKTQSHQKITYDFLPFIKPKISPNLSVVYSKLTEEMNFFSLGTRKELFVGNIFHKLVPYMGGKFTIKEISKKSTIPFPQVVAFVLFLQKEGVLAGEYSSKVLLPKIASSLSHRGNIYHFSIVFTEKNRINTLIYRILKKKGFKTLSFLNTSSPTIIQQKLKDVVLVVGSSSNKKMNILINKICLTSSAKWLPYNLDYDNSRVDVGPYIQMGRIGCFYCYSKRIKENHLFEKKDYIFVGKNTIDSTIQTQIEENISLHVTSSVEAFLTTKNYLKDHIQTLDFITGKVKKNALLADPLCPFCKCKIPNLEIQLMDRTAIYFENGMRIMNAQKSWNNVKKYIGHVGIITKIISFYKQIDEQQSYKGISADPLGNNMFRLHPGKGITSTQNRSSATFEAIERYNAKYAMLNPYKREVIGSYNSLKNDAIHPSEFQMPLPHYTDDTPVAWMKAWSLTNKRERLVPRNYVYYIPIGSSGLASGNCIEEAILHALFELIERDVYMIMDLNELLMPDLDLTGLKNPHILGLLKPLNSPDISYRIKYIKHDLGVPAFGMYMTGTVDGRTAYSHVVCAHLNKEIALSRTITEAIQLFPKFITGTRWLNKNVDHYSKPMKPVSFGSIPEYKNTSITENIKFCIELLKKHKLETFVVNYAIPGVKCAVVRVLVSGLQPIWFKEMSYLTDRVFSVPEALGYKKKSKEELNYGEFCGFPMLYPKK
ncbi:MAG: YcaO-like family protein [Candidatus Roizmanbacteria bacterium]|nr:YcaO-like family protein [Candidatus Roizmanbacteria bacterium]